MSEEYAMVVEFVKSLKPPKELRSALDIGFKFENGTAGLSADPNDYQKSSFAKFRLPFLLFSLIA